MFEWLFGKRENVEKLKIETKQSFENVKRDIESVGHWIKHLKTNGEKADLRFSEVDNKLASLETEIEGIKNTLAMMDTAV